MVNPECIRGMDFVEKYSRDYEAMQKMGLKEFEIKRALGTLQYVKDFIDTPEWLEYAKKLPKGFKWSEGTKYNHKGGKRDVAEKYVFLIAEGDLYIRNMLYGKYCYRKPNEDEDDGWTTYYIQDKRICKISNWKSMKANAVLDGLEGVMTPFLNNCILKFWNENGGKIGFQEEVIKEVWNG